MWCVAQLDPEYIARMEDVLELYEKPLCCSEPVVCIDEKPVVLHRDLRACQPMLPGRVARRDYEYKRCGTANVFCGTEPKAGRHFTKVTPTRRGLSSPIICWRSRPLIRRPIPSIWCWTISPPTRAKPSRTALAKLLETGSGTASRSITYPNTEAGRIKPRWKSACSAGNAWAGAESTPSPNCADKPRLEPKGES
jgi:hypothetical protein